MAYSARICLMVSAFLLSTTAEPICRKQQRDIICRAGPSDYILQRGLVSDSNVTTGITLKRCRITDVEYESFNHLMALQYLDLSFNKIKYLKLGVLDELQQVVFLNLSHNQITEFPLGLFDEMPNLEILDLKRNKLTNLELGILDHMKKLVHFDVSSNSLLGKHVSAYLFDQSQNIKFIDFSRNDMAGSDDDLLHAYHNVEFLNLDRCSLSEVPEFATKANLRTLKHLMLSTNRISALGDKTMFKNLDDLEILNLVSNSISSITEGVFDPLKKLRMILMTHNKLTQIPENLLQNFPKLLNVDLSHNLIEYVPVNSFRGSPIKNLNLSDNRFTYLTDNFCLELRNSGGKLAKFFFNHNPWQCACLRDVINEVKTYNIAYSEVKFDGKEPVCVTTNDFNCKRQKDANQEYAALYYNSISG